MSELDELKRSGAVPQKNSGRGKINKGDGVLKPFLVDVKEYAKAFSLTEKVWGKICTDAITAGRYQPALKIVLGTERKTRMWVIGDEMFMEMLSAWKEKHGD